ncbi:tubulin-tyrosine ligase family-domain-containing protein [Leucosporidium creatinivorum]|uniref:Tubulin-tyrosine ligase family-domain-containing protein n=1 Tax=Leucosporidium creatinivorum TaxID=106004 RepID=A0A1Y2FMR9_9BASI|nr:tubulin-tyrosine ligase family-domain-containing protein [Leucosporidium creatinivorum]
MAPAQTQKKQRVALARYPASQQYIIDSLRLAFAKHSDWTLITNRAEVEGAPDLQWSDYDEIDWDVLKDGTLVNSYVIRKGLIRKNHLAHTVALYVSKNPDSCLKRSVPKTLFFNLSFPDELDELLQDELYDVAEAFQNDEESGAEPKWWIVKAALADKGNGIRLFSSREMLDSIFENDFAVLSDDEEEESDEEGGTAGAYGTDTRVDASQLQEWVIQEYISKPLLIDPTPGSDSLGHKFHLRVYVVAVGGLSVYVHHPYLALFAPTPYELPSATDDGPVDLSSHLTNTCLQTAILGEATPEVAVSTLSAMADRVILGGPHQGEKLGEANVHRIEDQVAATVADVFKAAVSAGTSFQALPNAFEIFGVDFLVDDTFNVSLLEINACPDFAQTGKELQTIIDHLFACTLETAVLPYFRRQEGELATEGPEEGEELVQEFGKLGVESRGLRKVLDMQVSKAW